MTTCLNTPARFPADSPTHPIVCRTPTLSPLLSILSDTHKRSLSLCLGAIASQTAALSHTQALYVTLTLLSNSAFPSH